MAQNQSPNRPQAILPLTLPSGLLTQAGLSVLDQLWKQVAAGFVVVPCTATGTNLIILMPRLNVEGGAMYGDGMVWSAAAAATSTGPVTLKVTTTQYGDLATVKVFKSNGAAQADTGDIVIGCVYMWIFNQALDSGAGGMVVK